MRIIFFLLIALGAGLYFPSSRQVIVDTAQPVIDPVLRWSTRGEMRQIIRDLEALSEIPRRFPLDQEEFREWMEDEYEGDARTDPWGAAYEFRLSSNTFSIVSPGPDGQMNTDDDVSADGELRNDVRRERR